MADAAPDPNQDIADLIEQGHDAEAEAAARTRLQQVESRTGPDSGETADVLSLLVQSLWRLGKLKDGEARGFAERAIRIRESNPASRPEDLALSLVGLAQVLQGSGDLRGALSQYDRALTLREQALGSDHPEVGKLIVSVGLWGGFVTAGDWRSPAGPPPNAPQ